MAKIVTVGEVREKVRKAVGSLDIGGVVLTMQASEQTTHDDIDMKVGGQLIAYIGKSQSDSDEADGYRVSVISSTALQYPGAVATIAKFLGGVKEVTDEERVKTGKAQDTYGVDVREVEKALEFSKGKVEAYEKIMMGREITVGR